METQIQLGVLFGRKLLESAFCFFLACMNFKKGFCDSLFATTMFPASIH